MCLSTSSALVCCVKLFVRTTRRALAAVADCSLNQVVVSREATKKKKTSIDVLTRPRFFHSHPHHLHLHLHLHLHPLSTLPFPPAAPLCCVVASAWHLRSRACARRCLAAACASA